MVAVTAVIVLCYLLGLSAQWVSPEKMGVPTYFVMIMPLWIVLMLGVVKGLKKTLPERHHHLIPMNEEAIKRGMDLIKLCE